LVASGELNAVFSFSPNNYFYILIFFLIGAEENRVFAWWEGDRFTAASSPGRSAAAAWHRWL
jgi:hypothetical protein